MTPDDIARTFDVPVEMLTGPDEEGWAGTILIDPLTALFGGILGGLTVTALAWRLAWRTATRKKRP